MAGLAVGQEVEASVRQEAESNAAGAASETKHDPVKAKAKAKAKSNKDQSKPDKDGWVAMMPKKGMGKWKATDFGGQGDVTWDGKELRLAAGNLMTGVHREDAFLPTENYEIRLSAKRVKGNDFFCCLTFPIGKQFASFVAGGWGGTVTGISSLSGADASENETSSYTDFENGKWYDIRLVVTKEKVQVWIDDEQSVDLSRKYADFDTRIEVYIQQPIGICTFMTEAVIKDFKWRPFPYKADKDEPKKPGKRDDKAKPEVESMKIDRTKNSNQLN
ncbi:MAG: hypothetical protein Aurels2KO_26680 [Aureliella sp.]